MTFQRLRIDEDGNYYLQEVSAEYNEIVQRLDLDNRIDISQRTYTTYTLGEKKDTHDAKSAFN